MFAHIAAGVKGQDLALRHEVMHDAEEAFLHFAGVLRAQDDHFSPGEVEVYACGGSHVVGVTVTRELPRVVYRKIRSSEIL